MIRRQREVIKQQFNLSESLQKKLDDDWSKKIQLTVKDGKVRVKNKVGRWEKNKFKRYDGTYVKSDFVVSVVILIILMRMARWRLAGIQLKVQHIISIKKESCRPAGRRMARISII